MKTNERSCHGATITLKRYGLSLLTATLAFAIYGAAPAEAKPKARPSVPATVRNYEQHSKISDDFNDSYEMQNPSGGG